MAKVATEQDCAVLWLDTLDVLIWQLDKFFFTWEIIFSALNKIIVQNFPRYLFLYHLSTALKKKHIALKF